MTPLSELAARLRQTFPDARLAVSEPVAPDGVGFLDISHGDHALAVQWQEKWHFGVSSPEGHGYGEKPDEVFRTVDEAAARITDLLKSGRKTEPPIEVTLRELRAEKQLAQTALGALLGVSQPAVSRLERNVSRMMVATLRAVVQAMGGKLVLQAHFSDGVVRQIALDDNTPTSPDRDLVTIDEEP
jgi:DNA-binding XRE family transcriptional regulator